MNNRAAMPLQNVISLCSNWANELCPVVMEVDNVTRLTPKVNKRQNGNERPRVKDKRDKQAKRGTRFSLPHAIDLYFPNNRN
jgi:hypothetical protein